MSPRALTVRARVRQGSGPVIHAEFEAPPGITWVRGPSGAGKSTIAAAIAGVGEVLEGEISLGDELWDGPALRRRVPPQRRGVGWVPQDLGLVPGWTAERSVRFGGAAPARVAELLSALGLAHAARRAVASCSGGEQQRVALARALAAPRRLYLLDEATSALDEELELAALELAARAARDAAAPLLLISHHAPRLEVDRVVRLDGETRRAVAVAG